MAAMVGARRALLAARCSSRGELATVLVSPARRVQSLPSSSLFPYRCAGNLAFEQIDGDYPQERGVHNTGSRVPHSNHPTNYLNYQMESGLPSAGSSEGKGINTNRCDHVDDSIKGHYAHNPEQHYRSGGSYGLPNSHQSCTGARVIDGTPGYNAEQSYGSSGVHHHHSPNWNLQNTHQQHNGTQTSNGLSGNSKAHLDGYDAHSSGYNSRSNQKSSASEQVFQQQKAEQRSDSNYTNRPGNSALQYSNTSGSHKEYVAGFQQAYNGDFGYNAREPGNAPSLQGPEVPIAHQRPLNEHDTHSFGYNSVSNQQSYTSGQYGNSYSGQSYQTSTVSDHKVFQRQKVDGRYGGDYTNMPGNSTSQYTDPSSFLKEHVAGPQQGQNGGFGYNTSQAYQNPCVTSKVDSQSYSSGQYGNSYSEQSYQTSTVSDHKVFQQQKVDGRYGGDYTNRPGNSTSQYTDPSSFLKEHVAEPQQGQNGDFGYNTSQAYQNPCVTSKVDSQRNHPGHSMSVKRDVQHNSHSVYQHKHLDIQSIISAGNNLSSKPYQDSIYYQDSLPGNLSNGGSPSEVSGEASGKSEGTIEELDKLCEDGKAKEALEVLALLQEKGTVLHAPQYFKLIQACGDASALAEARKVHNQISQSELAARTDISNKILDMYAKCASMEDAAKLFSAMDQHDLTSWTTIISGFVHNGLGEEATDYFDRFKQTGDKPDPDMYSHIFMACGILGSVDEGMLHFESMQKDYGFTPTMEHYASIINMLGQSGYIDEARDFIERMPVEPSIVVWESLMNMCQLNGFMELGDRCAQIIEHLDPSRLSEHSKMGLFPVNATDLAKEKQRKKTNTVEARSKVHEYRAGDRSHPDTLKIYEELRYLAAHMKEAGYVADTRFVLHDVDQETKEDALLAHSERLAISYGLITSAVRSPIRVIKNLRSCGDCHTALKIISKLVGRLIIARDAKRFHHFENGVCSCKDYW